MITLGELERAVMDLLWESGETLSAYDLRDRLAASAPGAGSTRKLAPTTVLTVLTRLEKKGFVARDRTARPHRFFSAHTREHHMAELMHEVLGTVTDRAAVLERFVGQASPGETDTLRRLLDSGSR